MVGHDVAMRRWVWLVALLAASSMVVVLDAPRAVDAATPVTVAHPCGVASTAHYTHVVWIVLENQGYSVIGSPDAPFLNHLASVCGLATRSFAVTHPSLPNYLALTSGSTLGVRDDGEPASHPLQAPSIFSQLGGSWRSLEESMPSACDRVTSGSYAARHNPAVYYVPLRSACARQDVPMAFPLDLGARFTFITPNVCDDMHSCPIGVGDAWLHRVVDDVVASAPYRAHALALFITFDENDLAALNQVATFVVAPTVPSGLRVAQTFTHYSLLRTTETLLHLGLLGAARSARSMVQPFHL